MIDPSNEFAMKVSTFELNSKQEQLYEFVKKEHGDQKRKYTGEPYHTHCFEVAATTIALTGEEYAKSFLTVEIALCHDLFEDTNISRSDLYKNLVLIGYDAREAYNICDGVQDLTDKYTVEEYPYLNRKKRKINEAIRLGSIKPSSQTVKCADLISNCMSIVNEDQNFANTYVLEKKEILDEMRGAEINSYLMAGYVYVVAIKKLSEYEKSK